jgi:hypothetical protein
LQLKSSSKLSLSWGYLKLEPARPTISSWPPCQQHCPAFYSVLLPPMLAKNYYSTEFVVNPEEADSFSDEFLESYF